MSFKTLYIKLLAFLIFEFILLCIVNIPLYVILLCLNVDLVYLIYASSATVVSSGIWLAYSKYINNGYYAIRDIMVHKYYVLKFSVQLGIPVRGILHDISKFSLTELKERIKYHSSTKSPITIARKEQGYSKAWLHHKGHNKHHFEYWLDVINNEYVSIRIPLKYMKEMYCDWLAAAVVYNYESTCKDERQWWINNESLFKKYLHPTNYMVMRWLVYYMYSLPYNSHEKIRNLNLKELRIKFEELYNIYKEMFPEPYYHCYQYANKR